MSSAADDGFPLSLTTVLQEPRALSSLIDSIPALVASIDCNMILRFCNKPFKTWFSLDDDIYGKSFPVVVGRQVFDQLQRHMGKVLVGERVNFQISVNTDKGFQCLDATLSPEFDDRKMVIGFIFHSSDVTQKNKTERALKDYFENATIGLHWVNAEGIITWANPAELNMLGYKEDEYIGHHISEFHADKNAIREILTRLSSKQTLKNYEAELLCKNGSSRLVNINSTVAWEGEKFIHTRCFTIDVTEQRLAENAVRESEERFKTMANLVPLVIWTTDEKGNCNFLSTKWQEITGRNVEEGFGNGWLDFVHPDDRENIRNSWMRSFSARKPFEAKFRHKTSRGDFNINYTNASPRFNAAEEFEGYIGIFQDISSEEQIKSSLEKIVLGRTEDLKRRNADLKLAEKTLKEKNQELERINNELLSFAHVASHDLQEPLRKIQTFSHRFLELEGKKLSDQGKQFLNRIQSSSERMRSLIRDLLAYSKSSNVEGIFEVVDLNIIFNEVVHELELKIDEKNARIENLGLPSMKVIRFQFHQLFLNLLTNALKFSKIETEPHIVVRSGLLKGNQVPDLFPGDHDKQFYHISISDNGIGFEPQFSEKIFEIFHRIHGKRYLEGTGIGLAICKKIVENHRGRIIADSGINQGTTFHIYLHAEK